MEHLLLLFCFYFLKLFMNIHIILYRNLFSGIIQSFLNVLDLLAEFYFAYGTIGVVKLLLEPHLSLGHQHVLFNQVPSFIDCINQ